MRIFAQILRRDDLPRPCSWLSQTGTCSSARPWAYGFTRAERLASACGSWAARLSEPPMGAEREADSLSRDQRPRRWRARSCEFVPSLTGLHSLQRHLDSAKAVAYGTPRQAARPVKSPDSVCSHGLAEVFKQRGARCTATLPRRSAHCMRSSISRRSAAGDSFGLACSALYPLFPCIAAAT